MKHSLLWLGLMALLGLVSGCKREDCKVVVEVHKDGSYRRITKFDGHGDIPYTLENRYVLPKGAGWKVSHTSVPTYTTVHGKRKFDGFSESYGAERNCKEGETINGDISIRAPKDKALPPVVVNSVTVQRLSPTQIEYRETLEWQGPRTDIDIVSKQSLKDAELFGILKRKFPANLLTPERTQKLQNILLHSLWRSWFSRKRDSFWWKLERNEEEAFRTSYAPLLTSVLETVFGSDLSAVQRSAIVRASSLEFRTLLIACRKEKDEEPTRYDPAQHITFAVTMPGRVVETDGQTFNMRTLKSMQKEFKQGKKPGRNVTNKDVANAMSEWLGVKITADELFSERVVIWQVDTTAAMLEPIELRAVCEVKP